MTLSTLFDDHEKPVVALEDKVFSVVSYIIGIGLDTSIKVVSFATFPSLPVDTR